MKSLMLTIALILASSISFAKPDGIECPKIKLVCSHSVLSNMTHNYEQKSTQESPLAGVNNDEPSLPHNECESYLSFNSVSQKNKTLRAFLNGEDVKKLMAFVYVSEISGATYPQFSIEVNLNQTFKLHLGQEELKCKVVDYSSTKSY